MRSVSVPSEAVVVYNNALTLSSQGNLKPALEEYRKAIGLYPRFLEAYNNIGEIYSKLGDSENAISTYLQALKIDRNYRVLVNLGVEYYNKGEYLASLTHFKESLALKSDFLEGHFYAGMAYFNIKNYNEAEKHFSEVVKIDKKHAKANYLLSYIYYDRKDYRRALECLELIKDSAEDVGFVNRYYGFCLFHLGRYEECIDYLKVALESNPKYAKFRSYLDSLTYEKKMKEIGDIAKCIRELEEKMTTTKPSFSEYTHLSMLYVFNGEYKKAEELLCSAKERIRYS